MASRQPQERPQLVFPHKVELKDGTIVEVNSVEDIKALKDECSGEG